MIKERERLGLSQEEVAKKIGVQRTTYTRYENGTLTPSLQKAIEIKKLFKAGDEIFLK